MAGPAHTAWLRGEWFREGLGYATFSSSVQPRMQACNPVDPAQTPFACCACCVRTADVNVRQAVLHYGGSYTLGSTGIVIRISSFSQDRSEVVVSLCRRGPGSSCDTPIDDWKGTGGGDGSCG